MKIPMRVILCLVGLPFLGGCEGAQRYTFWRDDNPAVLSGREPNLADVPAPDDTAPVLHQMQSDALRLVQDRNAQNGLAP